MAELRCEGLTKSYGDRPVLRGLDLVVPSGHLTAVLGASGSGKTTLLRIVMGLLRADAGAILVDGSLVADAKKVDTRTDKRSIGYVAQEGALFPHLTVGENVGFGLPRSARRRGERTAEVLDLVGLSGDYARRLPQELSGGEQRRVALARALAPKPRLVLLDEPFSGLDAALRADTREAVLRALAREGATAVLVTHDQAEALSMGHEVAVLRDGRLVQHSAPTTLYRRPLDAEVARFVGEAVVLPGHARRGRAVCALGELDLHDPEIEGPVLVMIRPEQVHLARAPLSGGTADGVVGNAGPRDPGTRGTDHGGARGAGPRDVELHRGVAATAIDCAYYGPDTVIRLALGSDPQTIVKARTFAHEVPAPGERVGLRVHGPIVAYPADSAGSPEPGPGAAENSPKRTVATS